MARDYKFFKPHEQLFSGGVFRFVCLFGYNVEYLTYKDSTEQKGALLYELTHSDKEAVDFVQLTPYSDGAIGGAFVGIHPFDILVKGWTLEETDEFLRGKLKKWGFNIPDDLDAICAEYVFEA